MDIIDSLSKYNELASFQRIMIFGLPGSGKSTFALKLGKLLDLPVFHVDRYFFIGQWEKRDHQEFLDDLQKLVAQERWIIEGNATRSFDVRYARADVAIYFKMNRWLCLYRLFKRWLFPDTQIQDSPEGATKQVSWSLIKYLWGYDARVKENLLRLKQSYPRVKFYIIHTAQEAAKLLNKSKVDF